MAERILEVCKVAPPLQGSPTDDISFPLTFLDLVSLTVRPAEILFFYEEAALTESLFSGSIIPKLKQCLSATLQHFMPLSGHLTWTTSSSSPSPPVILYKEGDGVLLTVAVSNADFDHLSGKKNIRQCDIFRPLVAKLVGSDSQVSVLALKVSLFPNKGFCICITVHHGVFDAKSVELFMKLWASISRFGEIEVGPAGSELTPVLERKIVGERYAEIESSYIELLKRNGVSLAIQEFDLPAVHKVRGTFELSRLEVRKLKELIIRDGQVSYVSTLITTCAYVILCMVKTKGVLTSNRICLSIPVDIRGRLEPPLPANYFGNCLGLIKVILDKEELLTRDDGMAVIVNSISKTTKGINENYDGGVLKWMPNADDDTGATMVVVVGSSRFGFQHIDFGWGRPKKMDITLVDTSHTMLPMRAMTITEVEDDGGVIEVELSLNKHEMECFSCEFAQGLEKMAKHRPVSLL